MSSAFSASLKNFTERCEAQKIISAKSEWIHFGASRPAVIPAGTDGNTKDLTIYAAGKVRNTSVRAVKVTVHQADYTEYLYYSEVEAADCCAAR